MSKTIPLDTAHIQSRLMQYCMYINSFSYRTNTKMNEQHMNEILHQMWEEMLSIGLFSNFEKFPESPLTLHQDGAVSCYTFIFRECPFGYDGGEQWEVKL